MGRAGQSGLGDRVWPEARGALAGLIGLFTVVGSPAGETRMATGKMLSPVDLLLAANNVVPGVAYVAPVQFSSTQYAEVRRTWVTGFLRRFQDDLRRMKVPAGLLDERSETAAGSTVFTDLFLGNANAELMTDLWHSKAAAQRPAILAIWYTPDAAAPPAAGGRPAQRSVLLILTDGGPIFVDPRRGEIKLSIEEVRSISHRRA